MSLVFHIDKWFFSNSGSSQQKFNSLEENIILDYDWQGGDLSHEELKCLASLLREVLIINPIGRKAAGEVAQHPWLLAHTSMKKAD